MLLREGVFQMEWLQNRWLTMFYVSKRGGARKYISHWLSPSLQKALWLGKCMTLSSLLRSIFESGIFISLNLSLCLCLPLNMNTNSYNRVHHCLSNMLQYAPHSEVLEAEELKEAPWLVTPRSCGLLTPGSILPWISIQLLLRMPGRLLTLL